MAAERRCSEKAIIGALERGGEEAEAMRAMARGGTECGGKVTETTSGIGVERGAREFGA